jgi:hypothetical protein
MSTVDINGRIHPSPKVSSVTIPVNAPSAEAAERAIRQELAKAGRTLVEGESRVTKVERRRPFRDVAIDIDGSDQCYLMRVQYVKAGA